MTKDRLLCHPGWTGFGAGSKRGMRDKNERNKLTKHVKEVAA